MAIQLSLTVRNNRLDSFETSVGLTPVLKIFTGAQPANCAAANTGTELVSMTLPSDWMNAASSGSKTINGTWSANGIADGNAGHFRLYASNGTSCHMQGSVTGTGGGGDMILTNINIANGQTVTIVQFTLTEPNS